MKAVVKKLPAHMTVQNLKGLLQRLYKIDTSRQKVSYFDERVGTDVILCIHVLYVCDYVHVCCVSLYSFVCLLFESKCKFCVVLNMVYVD